MLRRPPRSTPFPTRRSSDLDASTVGGPGMRGGSSGKWKWALVAAGAIGGGLAFGMARSKQSSPGADRKSTRLNSSHSQISYAVFCLKKKIRHHHYTTSLVSL